MNRDRLTRERRSWNMSRIRGRDTSPELLVRSVLHRLGYRFRLNRKIEVRMENAECRSRRQEVKNEKLKVKKSLLVRPDIVLPKYKTAIFVHGCFWHRHKGCKNCTTPTHRREWWLKKLEGNAARDKIHQRALRKLGWRVVVIWECESEKRRWLVKLNHQMKNIINGPLKNAPGGGTGPTERPGLRGNAIGRVASRGVQGSSSAPRIGATR